MLKPPTLGTVIDLPQLGDPPLSFRQVVHIAQSINREAGLTILGKINLLLGVAAIREDLGSDRSIRAEVQKSILRDTISVRRQNQLREKFGKKNARTHAVFHRAQVLAAIRLLALYGSHEGNRLQTRDEMDVLADFALAINGLLDQRAMPKELKALYQLAPTMAPSQELENLPRIDNAIVRSHLMLGEHLQERIHLPLARQLEQIFVFLSNGFDFETFQSFMFAVFAYFEALPANNLPRFFKDAFLNPHAPGNVIGGPLLEQFLANISVDISAVPNLMPALNDERTLLFDHRFIRASPVWRYSPRHYLCVDPCFLIEKLAAGFYWAVNKALDTGSTEDAKKRTYEFSSLWGYLFEDYVQRLLRYAVPQESTRLVENPFYTKPKIEAFDSVVLEGTNAIVFQVKGTFAEAEGKYSGVFSHFFESLSTRFGNTPGAAVGQLATNIRHTFCLPRSRQVPAVPVESVRTVWPVVVVLEPILDNGFASRLMIERFMHRTRDLIPQLYTSIRPPVFLQIEDLETIVEHVKAGDYTFRDVLRAKLGFDPTNFFSFSSFYWGQFVPEHKIKFRRNQLIRDEFNAFSQETLRKSASGEYLRCHNTPYGAVYPR